jgi:hypothetical protein
MHVENTILVYVPLRVSRDNKDIQTPNTMVYVIVSKWNLAMKTISNPLGWVASWEIECSQGIIDITC